MIRRLALSLAVLAGLSACSAERDPLAGFLLTPLSGLFGGGEAQVDARQLLSRDLIATADQPFILVGQLEADAWFTALAEAENRGYESYRAGDGTGLVFADGILTGTRGLGFDLHTAEVEGAMARIYGGGEATTERVHRVINGNDQIVAERFLCGWQQAGTETLQIYGVAYPTRRVIESCRSDETEFVNEYWVGNDGVLRQSRQHVSDEIGAILVQQLVP